MMPQQPRDGAAARGRDAHAYSTSPMPHAASDVAAEREYAEMRCRRFHEVRYRDALTRDAR